MPGAHGAAGVERWKEHLPVGSYRGASSVEPAGLQEVTAASSATTAVESAPTTDIPAVAAVTNDQRNDAKEVESVGCYFASDHRLADYTIVREEPLKPAQ